MRRAVAFYVKKIECIVSCILLGQQYTHGRSIQELQLLWDRVQGVQTQDNVEANTQQSLHTLCTGAGIFAQALDSGQKDPARPAICLLCGQENETMEHVLT